MVATLSAWFELAERHAAVLLGLSLGTLLMTFILLPVLILRLPKTYFLEDDRPPPLSRHLPVHLALMAIKNVIGLAFVVLGVLLLFLPGQGLLTIIIGLTVMNYPGKFMLERWLVRRRHVMPALNWLRRRYGAEPFEDP